MSIRIGILGYGNLGRGVECAVKHNPDLELVAVFTRRDPASIQPLTEKLAVYSANDLANYTNDIDVLVLCGGSATDLPEQTPEAVKLFNVVDSFDTHAKIPTHFANVDAAAKKNGHIGIISVGWDPGMFSVARLYSTCILPDGNDYTFWGRGVSQGHSDAIRRISGVVDARQYTVPVEAALNAVRAGENPSLTTREKHTRECYVVAEEDADLSFIENSTKNMPYYFLGYETEVNFITEEEFKNKHRGMSHGGFVICSGNSGENNFVMEFKLVLHSNPEFTGSILVAYARAIFRMYKEGKRGAYTIFDVPISYLSSKKAEDLRKELL